MKSVTIEEARANLPELLKPQNGQEPLVITENSRPVGLLLRLPAGAEGPTEEPHVFIVEPLGYVVQWPEAKAPKPEFGSCQGMVTIVADDDEHLEDFREYME